MTTTKADFTYTGMQSPFDNSHLYVELRNNGAYWWARATWDDGNAGCGAATVGTLKLQLRHSTSTSSWGAWETVKTKSLVCGNTQIWTSDTYNPPNSTSTSFYQVRAAFTGTANNPQESPLQTLLGAQGVSNLEAVDCLWVARRVGAKVANRWS